MRTGEEIKKVLKRAILQGRGWAEPLSAVEEGIIEDTMKELETVVQLLDEARFILSVYSLKDYEYVRNWLDFYDQTFGVE